MTTLQKIVMGALVLAVIFLIVFSQIQMGNAEKEKEKAIMAQQWADENAKKAEAQAGSAQRAIDEASQQVEQLRAELEVCKKKK